MFLQVSVNNLFTGEEASPPGGRSPLKEYDTRQKVTSKTPVLTSDGRHQSGRYASYWNAFLLLIYIFTSVCQEFCPGVRAWWGGGVRGRGGMHGGGACMGEHSWVGGGAWQEKRQLQWAVRILLECILVVSHFVSNVDFGPIYKIKLKNMY